MKAILDWLDHRTGVRAMTRAMLYEHIPGGSRWRYVWGSTLVFTFAVQMVTGFFLWMAYSPSAQTAWESVYYIQNQMTGGWLLRGIHHYTAQAMIVLLALHMLQVIIDGAYRAPREVNFWIGLILLQLVLALSLTGYLLPWDQKGYWATGVATNLMARVPVIGPALQRVVVGGADYGHHTLTRFFALHAGLLPFLMIVFIAAHVYVFRRHGIKHKEPVKAADRHFWPDQVLKDAVACLGVLLVVLILSLKYGILNFDFSDPSKLGAELGPPADPTNAYSAPRPEWYIIFLFQFLKFEQFKGDAVVWGAVIIPGIVMAVLFLMPLIGKWKVGHYFNVILIAALLFGTVVLTGMALWEDRGKTDYQASVRQTHDDGHRAVVLAREQGIPPAGALTLLREDAKTQGARLFAANCASCHRYGGTNGLHYVPNEKNNPQSAPDLKDFASREWIAGLLDPARIDSPHYFGRTKFANGRMAKFVKDDVKGYSPEEKKLLDQAIKALSAEARLPFQRHKDAADAADIAEGRKVLADDTKLRCAECHAFGDAEGDRAPTLIGYGSRDWLMRFIANPGHEDLYGRRNDRMPAFGEKKLLTEKEIGVLADWIRGDWFEPGRESTPAPATQPATQPATNLAE